MCIYMPSGALWEFTPMTEMTPQQRATVLLIEDQERRRREKEQAQTSTQRTQAKKCA